MRYLIVLGLLFSGQLFAEEKYNCGSEMLKELESVKVSEKKDFKQAQLTMIKGIPCLGKQKYTKVNVAVLKIYSKMSLIEDFPQAFEVLFPYYDRYQKFFESNVLDELSDKEKEIVVEHYKFIKFQLENGNG